MDIIHDRKGKMIDPTVNEIGAMQDAAERGGEFLEGLGKTDLATMTADEWMQFVDAICTGFVESMQYRQAPPEHEARRAALFGPAAPSGALNNRFIDDEIPF